MNARKSLRRWLALIAAAMVLLLAACTSAATDSSPMHSGPEPMNDTVDADSAPADVMPEAGDVDQTAPQNLREDGGALPGEGDDTMLIVNKTMRMEVEAADATVEEIRKAATARGGGITEMEVSSDGRAVYPKDGERSQGLRGWLTVRVPSDGYNAFVADVAEMGEVLSQSEESSDVTQQHVDLSARLENLRAQEARLREFFDAATTVDEMLTLEKELGRVRGDIESLDAQVKHLERKAAMVTVNIHLTEADTELAEPERESWGVVDAITDGLRGAVSLINGVLTFVLATAPLWIVGLIAFFPVRAWVRRRRAERMTVMQPMAQQPQPPANQPVRQPASNASPDAAPESHN